MEAHAHITPGYPKENIEFLIHKSAEGEKLSERDYELLFRQTGLGRAAVDFLIGNNREQELLGLQEMFFADVTVECEANTIVTREERITADASIPYVENGDILITFNSHALGWRNGHAAMVVDAEKRLTLEARVLGTSTTVMSMNHWESYPSFVVLRLKNTTKEQREAIASYAVENLTDIPYRLEAGVMERLKKLLTTSLARMKATGADHADNLAGNGGTAITTLSGTHCAHLVWYAYEYFGYDLDSDGGMIVTPGDIFESPLLEIVQIYGMQLNS